jgi:hypothetical protein
MLNHQQGERLLTTADLAVFLGKYTEDGQPDLQAIYFLNWSGGPPRYKIGRENRYRLDEVMAWLESRRVEPGATAR